MNNTISLSSMAVADRSRCTCCLPCGYPSLHAGEPHCIPKLVVYADPSAVQEAVQEGLDIEIALKHVFGAEDGIRLLLGGDVTSMRTPPRAVAGGGMNHVFMIEWGGRLIKCIRLRDKHLSEAQEAERLCRSSPLLPKDAHAIFPVAIFTCVAATGEVRTTPAQDTYEVLIFSFLEKSRSVAELVRTFERTHPAGMLQSTAVCSAFRQTGHCEHVQQLQSLLVDQLPMLGRRFQVLHGRRHGDFKVDNALIDGNGNIKFVDFLSPFCQNCDQEEFLASTLSLHPTIQELRTAFTASWRACADDNRQCRSDTGASRYSAESIALNDYAMNMNLSLAESLEELVKARMSNFSGSSLFGPLPSLLDGIGSGLNSNNLTLPLPSPQVAELPSLNFSFSIPQDLLQPPNLADAFPSKRLLGSDCVGSADGTSTSGSLLGVPYCRSMPSCEVPSLTPPSSLSIAPSSSADSAFTWLQRHGAPMKQPSANTTPFTPIASMHGVQSIDTCSGLGVHAAAGDHRQAFGQAVGTPRSTSASGAHLSAYIENNINSCGTFSVGVHAHNARMTRENVNFSETGICSTKIPERMVGASNIFEASVPFSNGGSASSVLRNYSSPNAGGHWNAAHSSPWQITSKPAIFNPPLFSFS